MGIVSALQRTVDILQESPSIVAFALGYNLLFVPASLLAVLAPRVGWMGSLLNLGITLFVLPFFLGGILTLAARSLSGTASVSDFVDGGKDHYLPMIAGIFASMVYGFGAAVVLTFVGIFLVLGIVVGTGGGSSTTAMVLGVAVGIAIVLAALVPLLPFQFYPAAVAVEGLGVVDGVKRTLGVVRENPLQTFVFDLVALAVYVVNIGLSFGLLFLFSSGNPFASITSSGSGSGFGGGGGGLYAGVSLVESLLQTGIGLVVGVVLFAFLISLYVAVYTDATDGDEGDGGTSEEWREVDDSAVGSNA